MRHFNSIFLSNNFKTFLILFSFIFIAFSGFGQSSPINESFSNLGPYGGYKTETWIGDDGGTWTATDARTDRTINGKAIMVRNGVLTSPSVSGGIGSLTVTTQRQFSGGSGDMDLKVNGIKVGTIPYSGIVQTTTISNINISGNVTIIIDATNSSSDRVVIDDLVWTAYSGTTKPESSNHASSFTASENGHNQIDLSWLDNDGTQAADGFLIKANTSGTFTDPTDATDPTEDTDLSDGSALVKVLHGTQSYSFTGLTAATQYYFKIWSYTNSGSDIDFKTDGTVPTDNAITDVAPSISNPSVGVVFISEVSDASGYKNEFLELYNTSNDIINIEDCNLQRFSSSGTYEYTWDFPSGAQIPANGFVLVSRGNNQTTFESEWGAIPFECNFYQGNTNLYFGTGRRWKLVFDDGSKAETVIDDTQSGVASSGNRSVQDSPASWSSSSKSNATPGELESAGQQTLPIKLTSFTAENKQNSNLINWTTASETNNAFFTLEKSFDALDFFEIAQIKGAGNSISELNYQFQDIETSKNIVYYRLKQTDFDGTSTYSEIISVNENKSDKFSITNHFTTDNHLIVNINSPNYQKINLQIININGQIVFSKEYTISNGINNLKIDKTKFKNSVYLISVKNQTYLESEKIVVFN